MCQLHILWHHGDALCMYGTQIGMLKQVDDVGFCHLLYGDEDQSLEP